MADITKSMSINLVPLHNQFLGCSVQNLSITYTGSCSSADLYRIHLSSKCT